MNSQNGDFLFSCYQDTLSEALLCFGASSVSIESLDEEEDTSEDPDEVSLNFSLLNVNNVYSCQKINL